jgi:hypothetical protein
MKQVSRTEYTKIHDWLRTTFGSAVACENIKCEKKSTSFEYAIKAGKTHKKLRSNYMTLCIPCHRNYDMRYKNNGHQLGVSTTRLSMKLLWRILAKSPNKKMSAESFLLTVETMMKSPNEIITPKP